LKRAEFAAYRLMSLTEFGDRPSNADEVPAEDFMLNDSPEAFGDEKNRLVEWQGDRELADP
jgi:hypothetical protein